MIPDHSETYRSRTDGSYRVACTCGAANIVFTLATAQSWTCHAR
jgi:hypothetical protein